MSRPPEPLLPSAKRPVCPACKNGRPLIRFDAIERCWKFVYCPSCYLRTAEIDYRCRTCSRWTARRPPFGLCWLLKQRTDADHLCRKYRSGGHEELQA